MYRPLVYIAARERTLPHRITATLAAVHTQINQPNSALFARHITWGPVARTDTRAERERERASPRTAAYKRVYVCVYVWGESRVMLWGRRLLRYRNNATTAHMPRPDGDGITARTRVRALITYIPPSLCPRVFVFAVFFFFFW